ncbi:hypothetical protein Gotri_014714 [Gossypium trilobum]|uniref:Uncharacterized protein n=1 Tax=Gossypium trilobum TaxID=34281 RepID=A0A7J9DYE5_9ROSI|nr:hypothetical protein [Gossypium trilobum]
MDFPGCDRSVETLIHALKDCPTARTILTIGGGLDNKLIVRDYSCCIDWIEDVMRVLDKNAAADFIITNFDATVTNNKTGYGVIVRADDGFVLGGGGGFKDEVLTSLLWAIEIYKIMDNLNSTNSCIWTFGMNYPKEIHDVVIGDSIDYV